MVKIIECPRDAMQGMHEFIPTETKISYINQLLKAGFDTIDFGSFVSPKAIPQMRDTAEVLQGLDMSSTKSKLLAIIANQRGAEAALTHEAISYLGYPLSISETFQQRNTNRSIAEAIENLKAIQSLSVSGGKTLVVYLSMGFGNPYGDPYSLDIVRRYTQILIEMGVEIISLSDTVGTASADDVASVFTTITNEFKGTEFGVHLHATPQAAMSKVAAAYDSGCRRFDGAVRGFGGCPMAKDDLTGNVPTEVIIEMLEEREVNHGIDMDAFQKAVTSSVSIF